MASLTRLEEIIPKILPIILFLMDLLIIPKQPPIILNVTT